jgi:hemerythrin-like domain-containing protein
MNAKHEEGSRREFLRGTGMAGAGLALIGAIAGAGWAAQTLDPDEGVTAPEDLMKEHGVLNRCLLIYEAGIHRLRGKEEVSPEAFHHTASLVRRFVEEYHERNEEKYIFPVFERNKKLVDLVATLKAQQVAGRRVTERILHLSTPTRFRAADNRAHIIAECESFIRLYRPH